MYRTNSFYQNRFFESLPKADFLKNDFDVSIVKGDENIKIVFIVRIAVHRVLFDGHVSGAHVLKIQKFIGKTWTFVKCLPCMRYTNLIWKQNPEMLAARAFQRSNKELWQ